MVQNFDIISKISVNYSIKFLISVGDEGNNPQNSDSNNSTPSELVCYGVNEAPRTCVNVCSKRICNRPINVQCKFVCVSKVETCDCIDGYLRNECGKCVKEDECNKSCK